MIIKRVEVYNYKVIILVYFCMLIIGFYPIYYFTIYIYINNNRKYFNKIF